MIHVVGDTLGGADDAWMEYDQLRVEAGNFPDSIFCALQQLNLEAAIPGNGKRLVTAAERRSERERLLDMLREYRETQENDENTLLPTEFSMLPVYPNPFNSTTIVRFDLPEYSHVQLTLYNVLGQEVRSLVNEEYTAGCHTVVFDGMDLASGVYYLSMQCGEYHSTQRMVLLK